MSQVNGPVTAIVGVGEAGIGRPDYPATELEITASAVMSALGDAGITLSEVDGVFTASTADALSSLSLCEYLGLRPTYIDSTNMGGSSFITHLEHASLAIQSGKCSVAVIAYGSVQYSRSKQLQSPVQPSVYERGTAARMPVSAYALATARHMFEFGTTREDLARVVVASRAWAALTPGATERTPVSVAQVLESRMVSTPLSRMDCCLVTDGAGAVVLVSRERAADGRADAVELLGSATATSHMAISQMPELTSTAAVDTGRRVFAATGLSPQDVDVLQLYDAFSINPLLFLEDLGFCEKGEGGAFIDSVGIGPGGGLPVNTNGGGLSYCHPGMYGVFMIIEAVRQLRSEAGARQVEDVEIALVHGNGGRLSAQATALLAKGSAR